MIALGDYLSGLLNVSRVPGKHDCCTFPANWAMTRGRRDPMAAWRGRYSTDEEAHALIAAAGGLDQLFAEGMESAGIPLIGKDYELGDIGVVKVGEFEAGVIFAGKRWTMLAEPRGLVSASFDDRSILAVWRP